MVKNETNKLVKGALLLTSAGILSKILSAGYRIPLQNLTGDLGFYMYQQIYPLLGMILILSLYGFPSAVSKMVVELKKSGKELSFSSFYVPIFFILLAISGIVASILFFNADRLAIFAGDTRLVIAYRWSASVFLIVPFTVLLRGVFQGQLEMKPIAYSQIGEQIARVTVIILGAYLFYVNKLTLEQIGVIAVWGSILGAIVATILLCIFFSRSKFMTTKRFTTPWRYYVQTLILFGIVASMNHMILIIIQFADVFTLVPHLVDYGLSKTESMIAKGVLDRGQPLIQLGTVLGSSFALVLIPTITGQNSMKKRLEMTDHLQSAILFSFYLAAGATIGLVLIFPETNVLLFQDEQGTFSLQVIALSILLSSLSITSASVLQGLGSFKWTAFYIVGAFITKWILNVLLVPGWGITGGALATVLSLSLLMFALLFKLKHQLKGIKLFKKLNKLAFLIAGIGMAAFIGIMKMVYPYTNIHSRIVLLIYVVMLAFIGAAIYFLILLRCRAFNKKELEALPLSNIWIKLHKERGEK